jgi:hypothetical protein
MAAPAGSADDLDAVRAVVDALKAFPAEEQRRILRWAQEKLGLPASPAPVLGATPGALPEAALPIPGGAARRDIRTFLQQKDPSSDNQFAAAVAYYFAFEAPDTEKKAEITAADLQHAARLSGRQRFQRPIYTLHNATKSGYLDKGRARGSFRLNTVGENLVAMAMPSQASMTDASGARRRPSKKRPSGKTRGRKRSK